MISGNHTHDSWRFIVDNFDAITSHFSSLPDPRAEINRKHLLIDVVVIAIMAVIAGAEGPTDINRWARLKALWLKENLELPEGVPSKDCFRRVLGSVDPQLFQECFFGWIQSRFGEKLKGEHTIAIDGKTMRRSGEPLQGVAPIHIVSAWCSELSITIGQVATEEKSNEITAIPILLDSIHVEGSTVTIDAMGCQKKIAKKIIEKNGDYALAVKENQPKLHNEIVEYFEEAIGERTVNADVRQYVTSDEGHGRIEVRSHYVAELPKSSEILKNWAGAKAIGMVVRESEDKHGRKSNDRRYYLLSRFIDGERFATVVRSHWGIENSCHWVLDVVFDEDRHRTRDRTLASNMTWLSKFAMGLIKQHPLKDSIKGKRKRAGWNDDFLLEVLKIQG